MRLDDKFEFEKKVNGYIVLKMFKQLFEIQRPNAHIPQLILE